MSSFLKSSAYLPLAFVMGLGAVNANTEKSIKIPEQEVATTNPTLYKTLPKLSDYATPNDSFKSYAKDLEKQVTSPESIKEFQREWDYESAAKKFRLHNLPFNSLDQNNNKKISLLEYFYFMHLADLAGNKDKTPSRTEIRYAFNLTIKNYLLDEARQSKLPTAELQKLKTRLLENKFSSTELSEFDSFDLSFSRPNSEGSKEKRANTVMKSYKALEKKSANYPRHNKSK